ncbi:hypothetical protein CUC15_10365 [Oceanobacillus zhaokaii]|uniref:Uncharacterized protein n=1 Tax=Oceanobacillus zhaokaii TaxID=2052660 RepID=A0A345PH20_9BACI|nr:hypothetical protein CUC15_10365 [Oceanobacillus zhaokaii]
MEILIRLALMIGIFFISYLICLILRQSNNHSLPFLITAVISLLLSFIWSGQYGSFLQTMGLANLVVALVQFARGRFKKA